MPSESDQGPCEDSDIDVEDLLPSASKRKFQGLQPRGPPLTEISYTAG